jgi:zinc protease
MHLKKTLLTAALLLSGYLAPAQQIPNDPQLRTGVLSNGFTYYIRHNEEPNKRVELYLVNKAGSVLEDDDQQGLAHFTEHMSFNGTEHFPKNELVNYLQKAGIRFGADLNAYTGFDETVYQLPIPTDDPAMFGKGLLIMRDWAQGATLEPAEIEKERGVILEEERLGKGAGDRMLRQYLPVVFNHSRYAQRMPIGKDTVLTSFKPEVLRRFYRDWYRPQLQALIVVGDVNIDEAEKMIRAKFSDLKNPSPERVRTAYTVPLDGQSRYMVVTDKEETSTKMEMMMKHRSKALRTESDYLERIKKSLLNQLLSARRHAELSALTDPAFQGISIGTSELLNDIDMLDFNLTVKEGRMQQAFEQTWKVLERIKRFGFTTIELDRAKQNYLRTLKNSLNEKNKTPSVNFVKEYQELFLKAEAAPGIDWEYRFTKDHMNQIGLPEISALMTGYLQSRDVDILVMAPSKDRAVLPDSVTVAGWMNTISKQELLPFKDDAPILSLLPAKPKPGKVVSRTNIAALGITALKLSNGVSVILKPTDFKNDEVRYSAFSSGGTSLYDKADFDVAANAAGIVGSFGWGRLNPIQLSKTLTGKIANSASAITARSQTINGNASTADLETALQLTYLQFTSPRKDSLLFRNLLNSAKSTLANRYADPVNVFSDTIAYVMGNYNYRSAPATLERLDKISLQRAYEIYKERFSDASGFTFVFTGSFKTETVIPLIEQYLGSLPSTHSNVKARNLGTHIPTGLITKKVYKGTENKASVRLVFSGSYAYSPVNNLLLNALSSILQIKVLQQLREAESEVYSPQVQVVYNKYPENRYAMFLTFGCAPQNADHLINLVTQEIGNLGSNGPEPEDIAKFKASYLKNIELAMKDNSFWLNYLVGQYENGESPLQLLDFQKNLDKIDAAALQKAAAGYLSGKNMITFELLPENPGSKEPINPLLSNEEE